MRTDLDPTPQPPPRTGEGESDHRTPPPVEKRLTVFSPPLRFGEGVGGWGRLKALWPGPALFLLFWLSLQFGGTRFLRDPGTFWHIATGEKILHDGFIAADPYTFTFAGTPWVPYQWLGEVGMALLHRLGGLDAVLAASTATAAGLLAWLAARLVRTGLHPIFAIGFALLAASVMAHHFHARPLLFTMCGMAAVMTAVCRFEAGDTRLSRMWWLVPLFWVWTNVHGGMLGGLTTLGLAGVGWTAWRLIGWPSPLTSWKAVFALLALGLACGLTAFASPYGLDMPRTWMLILNMPHLPDLIVEHSRFDPADPKGWTTLVLAAVYLVLLAGVRPGRPRVAWLVPLFWLAQAMLRVRHGSLFAVVATVAVIDLWPHTRYARWLAARRPDVYTPPTTPPRGSFWPVLATAIVCVAVAVACQWNGSPVPLVGAGSAKLDPKQWPLELLDDLKRLEPRPGEQDRTFCEYTFGGFLIYHTPGYKVFVDDRCEVFGDDWLLEFIRADEKGTAEAMARWQTRYGRFDFALAATTDRDMGYDWYFRTSPEWECVRRTGTATLYRKK
jgi:hypothetical protein